MRDFSGFALIFTFLPVFDKVLKRVLSVDAHREKFFCSAGEKFFGGVETIFPFISAATNFSPNFQTIVTLTIRLNSLKFLETEA